MLTKFPVRWTVTLGIHKTPEAYEQALEAEGFKIDDSARYILKKVRCSENHVEIHLTSATVAELGFPNGVFRKDLHAAILAQGGQLCHAEVGPALRMLLKNQPKGEWLLIDMEAISDSAGVPSVFNVEHDSDGLWLYPNCDFPRNCLFPKDQIVFVVP